MNSTLSAPHAQERLPSAPQKRRQIPFNRISFWFIVCVVIVWLLFPFYWVVRTSITPTSQLYSTPIVYWPSVATFSHYADVFSNSVFLRAMLNSTIVGVAVTVLSLVIGASAAYALARFNFRGRGFMMYLILSMTMFPQIAILDALFQIIRYLNLYDSLWALVISYMLFTLPFTVWILTSFFRALPRELEEASYVDGANPFQTFYRIMLPLAVPGMVTTGLLALIAAWNEFLYAVSFELTPSNYTVPLAITQFTSTNSTSTFEVPWGDIMAATVVVTIPLVLLVLFFQRRIVSGLTAGAVKG